MNVLILISIHALLYSLSSGQSDNLESCPADTGLYVAGRCLWPETSKENFSLAHHGCDLSGGVLVDISDNDTNEAVKTIIKEKNFNHGAWIGVHYSPENNQFTNTFNQTIQISYWSDIEPDVKDKQCTKVECVQMDKFGKWLLVCCSSSLPAICSRQLLGSRTSNVTNTSATLTTAVLTSIQQPPIVSVDSAGPISQLQSSLQLTMTTEPYPSSHSVKHSDLNYTLQSTTNSEEQLQTLKLSTEFQITPSTTATRDCFCPCERTKNLLIIENEDQLQAKIDLMRESLAVNKKLLSSFKRRKMSVSDPRPSSALMGCTLGLSLITLIMLCIVASDFQHLFSDIRHGFQNIVRAFFPSKLTVRKIQPF